MKELLVYMYICQDEFTTHLSMDSKFRVVTRLLRFPPVRRQRNIAVDLIGM